MLQFNMWLPCSSRQAIHVCVETKLMYDVGCGYCVDAHCLSVAHLIKMSAPHHTNGIQV